MPFETLAAMVGTIMTPPADNYGSPMEHLQKGEMQLLLQDYVKGFTGINLPMGGAPEFSFNVGSALNPFDFSDARYWKMLFWTGIFGKVRQRLVPKSKAMFQKIPILGRYIS